MKGGRRCCCTMLTQLFLRRFDFVLDTGRPMGVRSLARNILRRTTLRIMLPVMLRREFMKIQPFLIVLTLVNFALLIFTLAQMRPAVAADEIAPVLRGRALQIVDDRGRVRASINVYPPSTGKDGERQAETVLLRLITEQGRPSVKIGASEQTAGLALVGPSGTKETYVQLGANGTVSSLKLKNEDGRERVIEP